MQYQRIRSQFNSLALTLSLPALALASFLGATPSLAAVQAPGEAVATGEEPVQVANLFDFIETVTEGVQILENVLQGGQTPSPAPASQAPQSRTQVRTEMRQQLEQNPQRSRQLNEERQRRLAEDAAQREAHRQQREAYLQSLSPEERQAFLEAEQEQRRAFYGILLEGWAAMEEAEANAPSRNTQQQRMNMSDSEWACYIDPNCGR